MPTTRTRKINPEAMLALAKEEIAQHRGESWGHNDASVKGKILQHFQGDFTRFYAGQGVKQISQNGRDGWLPGLCLFHDDTNPSFSFNAENGAFRCFGCQAKGDIFTFYQEKNHCDFKTALKDLAKLAGVNGNGAKPKRNGKIIAEYPYTNEQGEPLHRTVKTEPKNFFQQHYDRGNWVSGLGNTRLVLFDLPGVLKASRVFFAEGEKDCLSLEKIGLCATCNPMGAGKLHNQQKKHHILDPLKGKRVFIIPDNDEPGQKHAEQAASLLYSLAKEVKIIELPDLPKGGDVSDFIKIHGDKARLAILKQVAATLPWTPPSNFISANELLSARYSRRKPIIAKGIFPHNSEIIISGETGVGKSLFRQELALHLVMAWDWLGFEVPREKNVCIFQFENSEPIEQFRLRKMCEGLGIGELPKGSLTYVNRKNRLNLTQQDDRLRLLELVRESEAEVIFYDCLSNLHAANENDNVAMRAVLDSLTEINAILGTACVVIHHFGKPGEGRTDARYRTRGASSIMDWAVTAASFTVVPHADKVFRKLTFHKVRDGATPKPLLLERDEDFLLSVTDEDSLCPSNKVREILQDLGGHVDSQKPFVEAIRAEVGCNDKSARKYIKQAVEMQVIRTQDRGNGRRKSYYVTN